MIYIYYYKSTWYLKYTLHLITTTFNVKYKEKLLTQVDWKSVYYLRSFHFKIFLDSMGYAFTSKSRKVIIQRDNWEIHSLFFERHLRNFQFLKNMRVLRTLVLHEKYAGVTRCCSYPKLFEKSKFYIFCFFSVGIPSL